MSETTKKTSTPKSTTNKDSKTSTKSPTTVKSNKSTTKNSTVKSKNSTVKKENKKDSTENKVTVLINDTKKIIIKNKSYLIIILLLFPFGFLFAIQNRKSYLTAIIYLIATILSIIIYFTLYNFFYYYS